VNDTDRGPAKRTDDPAGDAARTFAAALKKAGVKVTGAPREARAADESRTVATHRSAPLDALVERTLTNSDNDIAEALARQTAIAKGESASFAGARRAVTNELKKLEIPVGGAHFADGSGLDRKDRVTPALLTALLARAADPDRPGLRPVLTGLPIAGFSGTLGGRYAPDARRPVPVLSRLFRRVRWPGRRGRARPWPPHSPEQAAEHGAVPEEPCKTPPRDDRLTYG
ncbi:D-alanyl-D-alanine carboxypeptidase, partial [Streptomyces sp. MBT60]|uniref:D-alanyl-D-alanine carboxypeptidase n=1 Tax=Streptomyces sp. MBT60 TaxID=2800409 RepID=UPI001F2DAEC2